MARHVRPTRDRRWRKIRALLAGGLVLGIGATVTLATWNDSEYASGTFSTSRFDIQSSVDGTTWADHTTSGAAAVMTFSGVAMSPGTLQYAPLYIRTKAGSISGTLGLQGGTNTNSTLGAALVYRVVTFTGTCSATSFTGSPTFLVGTSSTTAPIATAGSTVVAANGTANTQMCFEISLPSGASNSLQGLSNTITWQVIGTSSS